MSEENFISKICRKCAIPKPICEFHKNRSECKTCAKAYKDSKKEEIKKQKQEYYQANKEHILNRCKEYEKNNVEKIKQTKKNYRNKNKEKIKAGAERYHKNNPKARKEYHKKWYKKNKDIKLIQNKKWQDANPDKLAQMSKDWYLKNKERANKTRKEWMLKNKEKMTARRREQRRERKRVDVQYKMKESLRSYFYSLVKKEYKFSSVLILLGMEIKEFKLYLESLFEPGMTWENWGNGEGKWNIDHILPCASFDLTDPEQQKKCFHYTNLQPLWWKHNMIKKDKLNWVKPN